MGFIILCAEVGEWDRELEPVRSIDALCEQIKARIGKQTKPIIGVDGMDGVGKTKLGTQLAQRLDARLISLDDYLLREQGGYVAHLKVHDIQRQMEGSERTTIVEGVCFRDAAQRCGITVDVYIYVRRIDKYGIWQDEEVCRPTESPEALKDRKREFRAAAARLAGNEEDSEATYTDDELGLPGELIDYHAVRIPFVKADIVFDVMEELTVPEAD
jgi:hypothetical protein